MENRAFLIMKGVHRLCVIATIRDGNALCLQRHSQARLTWMD